MPSTDSTPRIADSWSGTGISTSRSAGLRKYWSISFSASDSEARSSCTTLPMVWRSETRRYSSSIHGSSGSGVAALAHVARCARPGAARARPARGWSNSASSSAASRYSRLVATSIASGRRRRCAAATAGSARRPAAARPATLAEREQPLQRIADQRELLGQAGSGDASRRRPRPTRPPWRPATRLRACAIQAGSKRPSALGLVVDRPPSASRP